MAEPRVQIESLHFSVGILTISGGSLLLMVNSYGKDLIPDAALGVLLLIIASLLAYTGVRRCLSHTPLSAALCLTVSALWFGLGFVHILAGARVVNGALGFRTALVPGLAAFCLALFILGVVGILQKEVVLSIIAFAISLASAHQIASLFNADFGLQATAANFLLVCCVGAFFGSGRLLSYITKGKVQAPGTKLQKKSKLTSAQFQERNDAVLIGLVMNLLSASVLACPLLGVVPELSNSLVSWLWTAGVFQLGVSILSYRAMDTLAATFYGFTAILKFAEGYSILLNSLGYLLSFPAPLPIVFSLLFLTLAIFSVQKSLMDAMYQLFYMAYCISIAALPRGFFQGGTQGVQAAIFIASAVMLLVNLHNMVSPWRLPTGQGLLKTLLKGSNVFVLRPQDKDQHAPNLGYSKYADAEVLAYACSALSAFAIMATVGKEGPLHVMILPWVVICGGFLQLLCGSVAFARGKTLESTAFILYGILWTVWGMIRYAGLYGRERGFNVATGIICFMLFNCFVTLGTLFLSKAWFAFAFTFQLILISFLLDAVNALPYGYDTAVALIFGTVSFYCFLAHLFNSNFQRPQIPLGGPFIKLSGFEGDRDSCPHVPARKATSVQKIADILKNGGTCGMPTDTVYVLVATCNRPDAVEKAYKIKVHAQDRPMSLWISSIKQLEPAKHLINPVLWDFMEAAWPSSISIVIPRGPWMNFLGLRESEKYIGTPQSIAIRNPDCTVATHLMDLVGPIATMSANPTGEADTTHHNQVYAKLGNKVDGVLCDGPSPENIASTVVDCTKIESGKIGFFRVGVIPKTQVLQIFGEVQKKHMVGQVNPTFMPDVPELTVEIEPKTSHPTPGNIHTLGQVKEEDELT
ncbi:uncharacterized protein LOC125713342 [Brienomyrus brachyistius]|uniref:uncharacterized protein LOC125713342 n=1 Tax=Brienomyrus brachyistius TaxID=42636 RepID=UPI0020B2A04B|nr:uncharacterized protein LOC125713342 [Brienomyrus brachyistius]